MGVKAGIPEIGKIHIHPASLIIFNSADGYF